MCCTRLAANTGRKKSLKICHLGTIVQLCCCIFATKARIDSRKKLLNSNISFTCPYNKANVSPLTAEIGLPVRGTPSHFNGFRAMASLLQRRRSPEANQTLHDLWQSPGLLHYICILGALAPSDGILSRAKFTLRLCLAFSYIGSVTARHSSSGCQPNFVAWYREWNYGTFTEGATYIRLGGHHVGHRPTFQLCLLCVDFCEFYLWIKTACNHVHENKWQLVLTYSYLISKYHPEAFLFDFTTCSPEQKNINIWDEPWKSQRQYDSAMLAN